ncbi:hypothetical protein KBC70_04540, partial [Candidatus Woesebacteria bacterium]|nr:hypothetical protein [Candidatus Woesebacteria bacterium]
DLNILFRVLANSSMILFFVVVLLINFGNPKTLPLTLRSLAIILPFAAFVSSVYLKEVFNATLGLICAGTYALVLMNYASNHGPVTQTNSDSETAKSTPLSRLRRMLWK